MISGFKFIGLILFIISFNSAWGLKSQQVKLDYGLEAGIFDFSDGYYKDDYAKAYVLGAQVTAWPFAHWGAQLCCQYFTDDSFDGRLSIIPVNFSILLQLYNPKMPRALRPYIGGGIGRYNLREKMALSGEKINYTVNGRHLVVGIFIGRSIDRGFIFQAKYSYVPFDHPLEAIDEKANLSGLLFTGGYRF